MYGPPRIKRRRIGYGRRNQLVYGGGGMRSRAVVPRALRMIGLANQMHTFARTGERILITQQLTPPFLYQATIPGGGSTHGMILGAATAGDLGNCWNVGMGQTFAFNQLTGFGDLASLYDNFRIKAVKLRIDLSFNAAPGGSSANPVANIGALPLLHYTEDSDDASAPGSSSTVLQYSKSKTVRLGTSPLFITVRPRAQGGVVSAVNPPATGGATSTPAVAGTMLSYGTWLDSQSAQTVPHYGMKYFLENMPGPTGSALAWAIYITPTYILECKNIS